MIEMLSGTPRGRIVVDALASDKIIAYTSNVSISEAGYVLCRRLGLDVATSKVRSLLGSNYVSLIQTDRLNELVAEIKCARALALADCYCLATAKETRSKALFAFREEELQREISRKLFDVEITFLEDIA